MSRNKTLTGITFGTFSGIFWAVDTVLIGIVLSMSGFLEFQEVLLVAPLLSTFLHDTFSAVWMTVLLTVKGEFWTAIGSLKGKPGRIIVLAGTLGGPVGMTFYVLSIQNIGASYTAVISTVYPAVGAFFAYLILKDKLRLSNWAGLIMSITFIILLSYSGELVVGSNASWGLIFLIICIIGWGMECVVSAYAMKDDGIKPEHALLIRQYTSTFIYGFLIIPFFIGHSYTVKILASPVILLALAGVALAGTLSYVFYYHAINIIGPIRAMAMNITYAAWAVGFEAVLFGTLFTWKEFMFALLIITGSILTVVEKKKIQMPALKSNPL
ncbi:DMT family transporter [Sporosarcina sp. G11-34]|uniref:DMT family transporter n=1 Tax=Sporosarcina sp. G11-34 TaxID=2849605 RepID=UPI0022A9944B|nr:DMT family transporter [Sporosarcina sp. G11-34]MCZ2257460.1 DMT family transporter [Sporosarcina sp. G11-34]